MGLGGPMPMPGGPRKAPGLGPAGPKGPKPGGAGEGLGPLNDGVPRPCCIEIGAEDGRGPGAFAASPSSVPINVFSILLAKLNMMHVLCSTFPTDHRKHYTQHAHCEEIEDIVHQAAAAALARRGTREREP